MSSSRRTPLGLLRYIGPLAALALIVPGCSSMHWTKPGADAAAVSRDLEACRATALTRAPPPVSPVGTGESPTDRGGNRGMSLARGSNERFVEEHQDVQRCMTQRGYELRKD